MIDIRYNKPIEVTRAQYGRINSVMGGQVATRYDHATGKWYVKLWFMKHKMTLLRILTTL